MIKSYLMRMPRWGKRLLQVLADILLIWLSLWFTFVARLGWDVATVAMQMHAWMLWVAPLIAIPIFIPMGMYRAVVRYFDQEALITIFKSITASALVFTLIVYWQQTTSNQVVPRSYVLIYWIFSLALMGGLRLAMRAYLSGDVGATLANEALPFISNRQKKHLSRVAIYGAGAAGNQLLHALRMSNEIEPVAFLDDDESLHNRMIAGLLVYCYRYFKKLIVLTGIKNEL